jgi:hypothetical protein
MISLSIPRVTKYFIKHVDCRNLIVEKDTMVKLSFSARNALGLQKKENSLNAVLEIIQTYQTLHPVNHEFKVLKAREFKATRNNIRHLTTGEGLGYCWGIGGPCGSVIIDTLSNMKLSFTLSSFFFLLAGLSVLGITRGIYSSRRNSTYDLLHYFSVQEQAGDRSAIAGAISLSKDSKN